MDFVFLAKSNEVVVVEMRMRFDLVDDGFDEARLQQTLELIRVEVGDADRLDEALLGEDFEFAPRVHVIHVIVRIENTVRVWKMKKQRIKYLV